MTILDTVSGIVRPSRLTLLLGPPSSGKTTLLLALAGRLGPDLQVLNYVLFILLIRNTLIFILLPNMKIELEQDDG